MTPKQLKKLRLQKGYTQEEISPRVGVSLRTWCNWERGEVPIPPLKVAHIKATIDALPKK